MFEKAELAKAVSLGASVQLPALLAVGPFIGFFGVPIFGVLLLILLVDFITGIWKAKLLKRLNSNRFSDLMNRTAIYLFLFTVIHALVALGPVTAPVYKDMITLMLSTTEYGLFFGYCLKEMLSVFENLKAIQVAAGLKENFIIEMAIDKFGIDLTKALNGIIEQEPKPPVLLAPPPEEK